MKIPVRLESGRIGLSTKSYAENVSELKMHLSVFAGEGLYVNACAPCFIWLSINTIQSIVESKENLQK
jgi:hypothetical protein